ncbi:MAG: MCE family protein [Nannocystaceae bacterium]|nr:MCE family protein [Nannocystaceae bacterium]
MARERETRTKLIVGLFVTTLAALGFVSLFLIGQAEGTWADKVPVYTDFRTISGLRRGSPVQLAGVEIGTVDAINFVVRSGEDLVCDHLTEDIGRFDGDRTDDCSSFLFCSPDLVCAELEPYAAKGLHAPCMTTQDCMEEEICVTKDFRNRYRRVFWTGPEGVCARFDKEHRRVEVRMAIFADKLPLIREDSRATIAQNGVLGDQLVAITPGARSQLSPQALKSHGEDDVLIIQSSPSLYEDIELFRERIDGLTDKVDTALGGISSLFSELNDERTLDNVKNIIQHTEEITRQIAEGEGLVGALLSSEEYKADFGQTLRGVRNTAQGVDRFVGKANNSLSKIDKNLQPTVDDARETMASLRKLLDDLKDPTNKSLASKLLYDEKGELTSDLEKILADVEKATASASRITARIEKGEGTLGKLVNDSKPHDDLVKILSDLERNETFKRLTRYAIEKDDGADGKRRGGTKSD